MRRTGQLRAAHRDILPTVERVVIRIRHQIRPRA
jgi:hypothetical protein